MDYNSPLSKIAQKGTNAYEAFLKDNIDLKPLLDSRNKTAEVRKTISPYTGEFG